MKIEVLIIKISRGAETTLSNITDFEKSGSCVNQITADRMKK